MNARDKHPSEAQQPPIPDAVKAEVQRRLEAFRPGETKTRPWAEIYAEQLRKLADRR